MTSRPTRPGPPPRALSRLAGAQGGATAIEFGLLALPFLLLVTGIMDCSRMVWTHLALQVAVEQAARCAVVDATNCGTAAKVQAYAAAVMPAPGMTPASFSLVTAACGYQVSASLDYAVIVPGYLPASVTLTAQSCAPF
ncbi:MAG: TadE/TadG family type IV pilus assembly protein [Janthinobacterium lividum]